MFGFDNQECPGMCFIFAFQDHVKCALNADSGSVSPLAQMVAQGEMLHIVPLCGSSPCGSSNWWCPSIV